MPISVHVRNEDGTPVVDLTEVLDMVPPPAPEGIYRDLLPPSARANYPLLRYIDPYGDTCFNSLQAKGLLTEFEQLEAHGLSAAQSSLVRALRVLIAEQLARPHRYLWFIGD
jgi:hypothetical protein